jgi:hypothetical protein
MSYKLDFHPDALKEWRKLDEAIQRQFKKKLGERLEQPRIPAASETRMWRGYPPFFYRLDILVKLAIDIARATQSPGHFDAVNNRAVKNHIALERETMQTYKQFVASPPQVIETSHRGSRKASACVSLSSAICSRSRQYGHWYAGTAAPPRCHSSPCA